MDTMELSLPPESLQHQESELMSQERTSGHWASPGAALERLIEWKMEKISNSFNS